MVVNDLLTSCFAITFYNFLLRIYPLKNLNLLRLQVYLVALLKKMPKKGKKRVNLDDILSLDYYKLQKLSKDEKRVLIYL